MRLEFTKMQGLGNDFVVIDATREPFVASAAQIAGLADRRYGVGCDQLLVVEPAGDADCDFDYRIYNADGSEVGQCGNGARCLARFIHERGLSTARQLRVRTRSARMTLSLLDDGQVRVNMGVPEFDPAKIPFDAPAVAPHYCLTVDNAAPLQIGAVSMGNPHAVIAVDDLQRAPVEAIGAALQRHPAFAEQVNVGFLQVLDSGHGRLRVYERGAGETMACGSGACAAAVIGRLWGHFDNRVRLDLRGGSLLLEWEGEGQPVWMTGAAVTVYRGEIEWPPA